MARRRSRLPKPTNSIGIKRSGSSSAGRKPKGGSVRRGSAGTKARKVSISKGIGIPSKFKRTTTKASASKVLSSRKGRSVNSAIRKGSTFVGTRKRRRSSSSR